MCIWNRFINVCKTLDWYFDHSHYKIWIYEYIKVVVFHISWAFSSQGSLRPEERVLIVGPIGCRPYNCFFLLLLLLLQSLSRSSIKHQYFHDSSVGFNISCMVGKRTSAGFSWRWQRQRQRHMQRQIQGQRQSIQEESLPVYINLVLKRSNRYV